MGTSFSLVQTRSVGCIEPQ